MINNNIFANYKNQVGLVSFILLLTNSYQLKVINEEKMSYLFLINALLSGCADSYIFSNNYYFILFYKIKRN